MTAEDLPLTGRSSTELQENDPAGSTSTSRQSSPSPPPATSLVWRLYISHFLSTWNARTFEFGAVIFLAAAFPGTLFFASCYALFRSAAAAVLGSWLGNLVDQNDRLFIVRQSIVWQRLSVAASCLSLIVMLKYKDGKSLATYVLFGISVVLACFEKLAFIANTVAVERDWIIVVSDSLKVDRQELNSAMRRIDLVCKLIAPVGIGLLDGYSTRIAIWVVFIQNAVSVGVEYFAIAQVYTAIPQLASSKPTSSDQQSPGLQPQTPTLPHNDQTSRASSLRTRLTTLLTPLAPWKAYFQNPAFLASFSLSILYLTVLSFSSQMTTYLPTLGFTSTHISLMRLSSVILELSATCAAPYLTSRIGTLRSGLWFINEQLISIGLAVGLFCIYIDRPLLAGLFLISGVALSRLGLWGFDLSVQYLIQSSTPESTRGTFSATEMSLQNLFELLSFATTMIWFRPEEFRVPVYISAGAVAMSAVCFAGFVRGERGHLLHTDRCLKRLGRGKVRYAVLPTIEEEGEEG